MKTTNKSLVSWCAGIHLTPVALGRADTRTLRKMTGSGLKNKYFGYTTAAGMESGAKAMVKALCE